MAFIGCLYNAKPTMDFLKYTSAYDAYVMSENRRVEIVTKVIGESLEKAIYEGKKSCTFSNEFAHVDILKVIQNTGGYEVTHDLDNGTFTISWAHKKSEFEEESS